MSGLDGVPLQDLLDRLEREWGIAEKRDVSACRVPASRSPARIPAMHRASGPWIN